MNRKEGETGKKKPFEREEVEKGRRVKEQNKQKKTIELRREWRMRGQRM